MSVSHHLSIFSAQILQFFLHSLQRLEEVVVLLGEPLILLKHGLHLALCLSNPLQLDSGGRQREKTANVKSCLLVTQTLRFKMERHDNHWRTSENILCYLIYATICACVCMGKIFALLYFCLSSLVHSFHPPAMHFCPLVSWWPSGALQSSAGTSSCHAPPPPVKQREQEKRRKSRSKKGSGWRRAGRKLRGVGRAGHKIKHSRSLSQRKTQEHSYYDGCIVVTCLLHTQTRWWLQGF